MRPPHRRGCALRERDILDPFDPLDAATPPVDGPAAWRLQIEAMQRALAPGDCDLAKPSCMEVSPAHRLDDRNRVSRARLLRMNQAHNFGAGKPVEGCTTGHMAAGRYGRTVRLTRNHLTGFGAGCGEPPWGIGRHNRGLGVGTGPVGTRRANLVAPGARPVCHTLMAALVLKDGLPVLRHGVMGAHLQPKAPGRPLDQGQNAQKACAGAPGQFLNAWA